MAATAPTLSPAQSSAVGARRRIPHPLLWSAVSFAAGLCLARIATIFGFWTPPNWQLVAAILLMLIGAIAAHRASTLAIGVGLVSIALLGMAEANLGSAHPVSALPSEFEDQEAEVIGYIARASFPILESAVPREDGSTSPSQNYQQLDVQGEQIRCIGREDACSVSTMPLGIRVNVYERVSNEDEEADVPAGDSREFRYGQRLRLSGRIRSPQSYGDPGVFDRRAYLLENGIGAVLNAKPDDIHVLRGLGGTRLGHWREAARRSLLLHILGLHTSSANVWGVFSIRQRDAALLAAMILGERSLLDRQMKLDFQRTGSYHLLVVSGMAVAILAYAVFWLARLLPLPDAMATIVSVIFVGIYVSLTDLGQPVQRAALMCAVYMLARLLHRERNPLNAIGAAALVALVIDPKALFDAGFQMTFLAVLSIAGIAVPILERTTALYRKGLYLFDSTSFDLHLRPKQAQFRLELRMILSRLELLLPRWLARCFVIGGVRVVLRTADLVFISALMQAALALPMGAYFHRATTLALPANIIVVPMMSLLLPLAIGSTLLTYLGGWLAVVPKCVTALLLHLVSTSVLTFAHFRAADLRIPTPGSWTIALCIAAIGISIAAATRRPTLVFTALLLLGASNFAVLRARVPDTTRHQLEVTVIDVGQGDSVLVITPNGKTLLIDGGGMLGGSNSGFEVGEDVVSNYLWSRGFAHVDAVALTHAHTDHLGGLPAIIRNFHPDELWVAPSPPTRAYLSLIALAKSSGIAVYERVAGEKLVFGGAEVEVLAPPADIYAAQKRINDESMVLKIAYGKASALLEGDAERKTERLISQQLGAINLLKVAHHGSSTSSIPQLLDEIKPQFAVISVGKFNRYRHPQNEVLNRLADEGTCVFRTDFNGAVSVYLDENGVTSAQLGRERTLMRLPRWLPRAQAGHCAATQ